MRLAAAVVVFTAGVAAAWVMHDTPVSPSSSFAAAAATPDPLIPKSPRPVVPRASRSHRRAAVVRSSLNWDALAQCESSGNWADDTGNGYYGGVQFDEQTWLSVGGSGLPSQASKAEQIRRALTLYRQRGTAPWPVCGWRLVTP